MSQVEVPITLTSVLARAPAPTAPMWQSNAPPPMTTSVERPSRSAHSALRRPTGTSAVWLAVKSGLSRSRTSSGSSAARNSADGRPPHSGCQSDLCPAAQRPRGNCAGALQPASSAGTQSHSSTQLLAASRTAASARLTCRILAQNHSLE